jgi:DNA-binding NarL/FixJ family response regulator
MRASGQIGVLIVDDQAMIRSGLRLILESEPDLEVVGEAVDGAEAIRLADSLRPQEVLMDIQMPGSNGLEATRRLVESPLSGVAPRVVILTTFDLDEYLFEALRAGASGFLLKNAPAHELVAAVRTVAAGDALLSPTVTGRVVAAFASRRTSGETRRRLDLLSPRERDVLRLVTLGLTNGEIADRLVVGEATVKTHIGSLLSKLGLRDRVATVIFGYQAGVVDVGETDGPDARID